MKELTLRIYNKSVETPRGSIKAFLDNKRIAYKVAQKMLQGMVHHKIKTGIGYTEVIYRIEQPNPNTKQR